MIPPEIGYVRPRDLAEAVALLGPDSRVLAGGHSLVPALKLRQAPAATLVDIARLEALRAIATDGATLVVGAAVTYDDLARSTLVRAHSPVLARLGGRVADPQVRHRGTLVGALAHADPAGDGPTIALALGVDLVVRSAAGERLVPVDTFFRGPRATVLGPGDLVTAVRVPAHESASYEKFTRVAHMWAIAGACAVRTPDGVRVALANAAPTPLRAHAVERALAVGVALPRAAGHAADGTDPPSDVHGPAAYRRHLLPVLVRRALERLG